jgi:hypothetical protein
MAIVGMSVIEAALGFHRRHWRSIAGDADKGQFLAVQMQRRVIGRCRIAAH